MPQNRRSLADAHPWLFLVFAAAVMAPWDLVRLAVTGYGSLGHGHHEGVVEELSLELLNLSLVVPLIAALHIRAVVMVGEGGRPRLGDVARSGVRVLPLVAAAALVGSVGVTAAFVAVGVALFAVGAGVLAFLLVIPGVLVFIAIDSMVASFTALTAALLYFDLIARQGEATAAPAPALLTTEPWPLRSGYASARYCGSSLRRRKRIGGARVG